MVKRTLKKQEVGPEYWVIVRAINLEVSEEVFKHVKQYLKEEYGLPEAVELRKVRVGPGERVIFTLSIEEAGGEK